MRISTLDRQSAAKNQHDRPTCVAFALTALHEYVLDVLKEAKLMAEIDLSEEFLHCHAKKRDGLGPGCAGTTVAAALASLAAEGQSLEISATRTSLPWKRSKGRISLVGLSFVWFQPISSFKGVPAVSSNPLAIYTGRAIGDM
jgi:hypothetical protein